METNDYEFIYVSKEFLSGGTFSLTDYSDDAEYGDSGQTFHVNIGNVQKNLSQYQRLGPAACIDAYAVDFLTDRRTLVLVTGNASKNDNSLLGYNYNEFEPSNGAQYTPYEWYVLTQWSTVRQAKQNTGYAVIHISQIRSQYLLHQRSS